VFGNWSVSFPESKKWNGSSASRKRIRLRSSLQQTGSVRWISMAGGALDSQKSQMHPNLWYRGLITKRGKPAIWRVYSIEIRYFKNLLYLANTFNFNNVVLSEKYPSLVRVFTLPHISDLNGIVSYYNCSKFGFSPKFMFRAITWNLDKFYYCYGNQNLIPFSEGLASCLN